MTEAELSRIEASWPKDGNGTGPTAEAAFGQVRLLVDTVRALSAALAQANAELASLRLEVATQQKLIRALTTEITDAFKDVLNERLNSLQSKCVEMVADATQYSDTQTTLARLAQKIQDVHV